MSNKNDAMHPRSHKRPPTGNNGSDPMVNLMKDRWELLNAYLDSEVSPDERRLVERWLREDQKMQCLYARLLYVRRGLQSAPVPTAQGCDAEAMVQAVEKRINRRRPQRTLVWVGAAIAAFFATVLTHNVRMPGLVPNKTDELPTIRLDQPLMPIPEKSNDIPLQERINISLDQPLLNIPTPSALESSPARAETKENDGLSPSQNTASPNESVSEGGTL